MTFPEDIDTMMQEEKRVSTNLGTTLKYVLSKAMSEGRTVCGVYECAQVLNSSSDDVTMCILPIVSNQDVSVNIQHMLIEAFCTENDIKVLKVDSMEKLATLCITDNNNGQKDSESDFSCVLLTCPKVETQDVTDHAVNDLIDAPDHPIIEIPV